MRLQKELKDVNTACLGTAGFGSDVNRINKWCGALTGCFCSCFYKAALSAFPTALHDGAMQEQTRSALNGLVLLKKPLKQIYFLGVVSWSSFTDHHAAALFWLYTREDTSDLCCSVADEHH